LGCSTAGKEVSRGGNAAIYKPELHIAPVIATACALGAGSNICSLLHSLCFIWPPCDKAQRNKALPVIVSKGSEPAGNDPADFMTARTMNGTDRPLPARHGRGETFEFRRVPVHRDSRCSMKRSLIELSQLICDCNCQSDIQRGMPSSAA
jgi:hypothetical protein